jgi:hypothetical protein
MDSATLLLLALGGVAIYCLSVKKTGADFKDVRKLYLRKLLAGHEYGRGHRAADQYVTQWRNFDILPFKGGQSRFSIYQTAEKSYKKHLRPGTMYSKA